MFIFSDIYDFCIVGSGPGGSIPAVELARKGFRVIVLEAGTDEPDYTLDQMLGDMQVDGELDLRFGLSRQVGGATNLWAGRTAPLENIDFQPRAWISGSGWPITGQDLASYYNKAQTVLGLPKTIGEKQDFLPARFSSLQKVETKRFLWAPEKFRAGDHLRKALNDYPNLTLQTGWSAVEIITSNSQVSISHIEFVHTDGTRGSIKAKTYIIACGGIETPRLLLNSGAAAGAGADNVGRYFSTHPKADMATLHLNKRISLKSPLFLDTPLNGGSERLGLGFGSEQQEKHRLLNHYVQLSPLLEYKATRLFEKIKGGGALQSKFIDHSRVMKGILPGLGLFAYEMIGRLAGLQRKTGIFVLRGFLDQYPNRENRISLSKSRDKHGYPKADIKWSFTDKDKQATLRFFDLLDLSFREAGIGHVEYSKLKSMKNWPLTGIHSHFMGGCRMGYSPSSSVTDTNAKIHGINNLYVSGPALFSTYGYANPVLSITALALRLADHLADKVSM